MYLRWSEFSTFCWNCAAFRFTEMAELHKSFAENGCRKKHLPLFLEQKQAFNTVSHFDQVLISWLSLAIRSCFSLHVPSEFWICNLVHQFGFRTEVKSPEEIKKVISRFGAKFTVMNMVDVNGKNSAPVYRYLKARPGCAGDITWNFHTKCKPESWNGLF